LSSTREGGGIVAGRKVSRSYRAQHQAQLETAIRDLVADLMGCTHPTLDARMQKWAPTKYHSRGEQKKHGSWYEHRLGDPKNAARVIVCHDTEQQVIFLVARTASHDHDRLANVVGGFPPK
jgi:hypothetical protein